MVESECVHVREIKWQSVHARVCALKRSTNLKDKMHDRYKSPSLQWCRFDFSMFGFTCDSDDLNLTVGDNEHRGYKRGMLQPMLYTKKRHFFKSGMQY